MDKKKLETTNLWCGIDTIEVKTNNEIEPIGLANFIPKLARKYRDTGAYYYKLNPDKCNETSIYNATDYYNTINYMVNFLKLSESTKTRIDFRFDSFENDFDKLLKLNKLLILLIAEKYNIANCYFSNNPRTLEDLCIRVQTQYIEVECYNKAIEEPTGIVKTRLELRSKKLYDDTNESEKEHLQFMKWCDRLDDAISKENFENLQHTINNALCQKYSIESKEKGFSISKFLYKYQSSIFTSKQMAELYKLFGYKNPVQQASRYKYRNNIEYFSYNDLYNYVKIIKESGGAFFGC